MHSLTHIDTHSHSKTQWTVIKSQLGGWRNALSVSSNQTSAGRLPVTRGQVNRPDNRVYGLRVEQKEAELRVRGKLESTC